MPSKLLEVPDAASETTDQSDTFTIRSLRSSPEPRGAVTPQGTQNPEPPGSGAPLIPNELRKPLPSILTGDNAMTPTPTPVSSQSL